MTEDLACDEALTSFAPDKRTTMRIASYIALALLLASCTEKPGAICLRRGDYLKRDIHRDLSPGPGGFVAPPQDDSLELEEPEIPPRIYACGVENPGSENPLFVVFKDGIRVSEYKLGASALDSDSHFLVEESFFIVITEGSTTTVYLNGAKAFSFPAREYISSLIRRRDGVWTLGLDRSGDGFALRRDGAAIFSKSSGTPGRLYEDQDHLYFDYSMTVGGKTLRYLVKDGDDYAISAPFGGTLLAATVSEGEMWFLESCSDGWLLSCGERQFRYPAKPGFGFRSAELYGSPGGCSAVINLVALAVGMPVELICHEDSTWLKGGGSGSYHYYTYEPDVHLTFTKDMSRLAVSSFGGINSETIEGVRFEGGRCAMQYGGQIYLACSPMDGSPPFIWKRGNMRMTLDLNGYLSGIWVEAPD